MGKYSVVVYLFLMLIIVVVAEIINLCCHLMFGKKPIKKFQLFKFRKPLIRLQRLSIQSSEAD